MQYLMGHNCRSMEDSSTESDMFYFGELDEEASEEKNFNNVA